MNVLKIFVKKQKNKMKITLTNPKKVVLQEEKSKTVSTLTVQRVVDLPKKKVVRCFVEELDEPVVLWEGAAYDAIGQWTDADVEAKLTALYTA
jgi:hypothetical protein